MTTINLLVHYVVFCVDGLLKVHNKRYTVRTLAMERFKLSHKLLDKLT